MRAWIFASLLIVPLAHAQEAPTTSTETPAPTEPVAATETTARRDSPGEDIVDTIGQVVPGLGHALQQTERIRWDPSWPRYNFDELVLTIGFGLVYLFAEVLPTHADPHWIAGNFFDDGPQQLMGLASANDRHAAAIASDVLVGALVATPLLFDALLYAGAGEGAWDAAWQLALIDLEALAINMAVNSVVKLLARRERPMSRYCREESGYAAGDAEGCRDSSSDSFYSAHTSAAFTAASLVCLQHDALDLFGSSWADITMCGTALAAATATGVLRIVSDQQYLSDVLIGMGAGLATGLVLPWLLHFRGGAHPEPRGAPSFSPVAFVMPMFSDTTLGISAAGLW